MQQELGTDEDLSDIQAEIVNLKKVVNEKMWDESRQFYFDTLRDDSFSSIKSIGLLGAIDGYGAGGTFAVVYCPS